MAEMQASARAHPNIAFIKYWGNINHTLRLPVNGSISMNLEGLHSITSIHFDSGFSQDDLDLNGKAQNGETLRRVSNFLDIVRKLSGVNLLAKVESNNNFAIGSGIASSSSAFAALALASSSALGLDLDEKELSALARRGSGSASRSVPGGFVEWFAEDKDSNSYAKSIAARDHWDLVDCIAIVDDSHKEIGSSAGHQIAESSPLQEARIAGAAPRLDTVRAAILEKDFHSLAETVELESHLMHAVMMTSKPALLYWQAATISVLHAIGKWRNEGLELCGTIDAGPNVHVICQAKDSGEVLKKLSALTGIKNVLHAGAGGPAKLIDQP